MSVQGRDGRAPGTRRWGWRAAALAVLVACSGGGDDDGPVEARIPDVEGVLSAADEQTITVGEQVYDLGTDVTSASTYTREPVPLRVGTYVHAGLDDDGHVEWITTIGIVADTDPPSVRYTGRLVEVRDGRAIFEDGTALRVTPDLDPDPGFLIVTLDPATGRISISR